ncbi:MAG: HTTM domain-containing protein [Pirellulales bacterium]|nr:HTTM domain-containing protein [Pirellulales bacterium]
MGMISDSRGYVADTWKAWNRFWFAPSDPATLCLIRLLAGSLLFYTHLVWSWDLQAFLGPDGWLPVEYLRDLHARPAADGPQWSVWSLFFWIEKPWMLWCVHVFALLVFFFLMLGLFSRTTAVLGFLLAVTYAHRISPGAYFGLDKINCMLALYLMLGPCGARYSLDRIRRLNRGDNRPVLPSASANLTIRLIQLHLCIIYLFSGLAKHMGENWQAGTAVWWAVANLEYQSIDMTWLAGWPTLVALATHATVFWEIFYCCLIWNRFARPLVLWMAVAVHGGIALFMGMITFGLAMLYANLAFLKPATVRRWVDPLADRVALMLVRAK